MSQYIDLSAITGWSEVTAVDTENWFGSVFATLMDCLLKGATLSVGPFTTPVGVMNVRATLAALLPGFCTSTQVSKAPSWLLPVEPSARYQVVAGWVTPMESVAAWRKTIAWF